MRRSALLTVLGLVLACGLLACSESTGTGQDAKVTADTQVQKDASQTHDSNTAADTAPGQEAGGDAAQAQEAGQSDGGAAVCTLTNDTCTGGLTCQCCGAIGPKSICICSSICAVNGDCKNPSQPSCNKASSTAAAGICTPQGFNCCWMCQ